MLASKVLKKRFHNFGSLRKMSNFRIIEHKIPCSYVREFPQATANELEEDLFLAVKQYIPIDNPNPRPGDITIIGAHANGFPKELYEPLWEDLQTQARKRNFSIRSIWIADVAHQGASSVLNEKSLGNDPGWFDHARDLMHLINLKRKEMPRPLFGLGHSMGGNNLVNVALWNPRLFTSLILVDPVVQARSAEIQPAGASTSVALLSTFRRDVWPSRQAATESFQKSKFYSSWDKRVFDRWVQFGLRDLPTPLHPEPQPPGQPPKVTLTTAIGGEVFSFLRPNFEGYGHKSGKMNRATHPDIDPSIPNTYPFYRSEPPRTFHRLPELRPSALYIFGELSDVSDTKMNEMKVSTTGIGVGGSGGTAEGKVKGVTISNVGHLIPMEDSQGTAEEVAKWIDSEIETWREERARFEQEWAPKSTQEKLGVSEQWKEMMGGDPRKGPKASKI